MQSNFFNTKKKIVLHILTNGNKKTGEKIILKHFKKIQKHSTKQLKNIIQFYIIKFTPTFKILISLNKQNKKNIKKKETPAFITKPKIRNSFAIKYILQIINNKQLFKTVINQNLIQYKQENQQKTIKNQQKLKYFKWI